MATHNTKIFKHIDFERGKQIERGLDDGRTFTYIAREVGVEVSTIRREILRNRRNDGKSFSNGADKTDCAHLKSCKLKNLCKNHCNTRLCKRCTLRKCKSVCDEYERRECPTVTKAPFVCNACERYGRCTLSRFRYSAESSETQASRRLKETRSGIDLTEEEIGLLVDTVRAGFAKGQSIHHIFETYDLPCSERSFYRYVENQSIPILSIDLAKKVKYKKRRRKKEKVHETGFFAGHEYDYYLELPEEDRAITTEVDTVWGIKGDRKCILSLHRVDLHFQIYLILKSRTKEEVVRAFDWLELSCEGRFSEFFGLILLDRGSEFDDISGMERSCESNRKRCSVYFTDPGRADQKGSCEKNHVELRKVLPKGTSLQDMDAFTLATICSHVNSSIRKGCGNVSPMQMALLCLPQSLFDYLGLTLIPPEEVVSAPGILYRP